MIDVVIRGPILSSFQLFNRVVPATSSSRARAYLIPVPVSASFLHASLAVDDACNGILLACSSDNRRQGLHGHEL